MESLEASYMHLYVNNILHKNTNVMIELQLMVIGKILRCFRSQYKNVF